MVGEAIANFDSYIAVAIGLFAIASPTMQDYSPVRK